MSYSQPLNGEAECSKFALVRAAHIIVYTQFVERVFSSLVFPLCKQANGDFLAAFAFHRAPWFTSKETELQRQLGCHSLKPSWDAALVHRCHGQTALLLHLLNRGKGEIIIVSLQTRLKYLSSNVKRSKYGINYSNRFAQKRAIKLMQFDFFSINNIPNHFCIVWKDCVQIILSYGLFFFMQLVAYIC